MTTVSPTDHRRKAGLLVCFCLLIAAGCVSVEDHLTIAADGSWSVVIETHSSLPPMNLAQVMMMRGRGFPFADSIPSHPPMNEAEGQALFANAGIHVTGTVLASEGGVATAYRLEASGEDLADLLASRYAQARQLSIEAIDDSLMVTCLDPLRMLRPLLEAEKDTVPEGLLAHMAPLWQAARTHQDSWSSGFTLTLPGLAADDAHGQGTEGTVRWERSAAAGDAARSLAEPMRARAPLPEGWTPPVMPPRLECRPFAAWQEGPVSGASQQTWDADTIAPRWLPIDLQVQRTMRLTGDRGHYASNESTLRLAVIIPEDRTPLRWGEMRLLEAISASGTNLLPRHQHNRKPQIWSQRQRMVDNPYDGQVVAVFEPRFQPPPRDDHHLERLTVSLEATYPGIPHLIAVAAAIEADAIEPPQTDGNFHFGFEAGQDLELPALNQRGLSLSQPTVKDMGLGLLVQTRLQGGSLIQLQVYDVEGQAHPAWAASGHHGDHYTALVIGRPTPPLSLILLVDTGGDTVTLTHTLTDLPVSQQAADAAAKE